VSHAAELDRRRAWNDWGLQSCAHWLSWQCGFSLGTAREHVRVARILVHLPRTTSLFSRGELTYTKVRAITRVATPENEELLVVYAKGATASQLERIIRGYRNAADVEKANAAHDQRSVEWAYHGDGIHVLTIRTTAEQRAVMEEAQAKADQDVSAETLAEDADGECSVDDLDICAETARRLSCDAPVVVTLINGEGVASIIDSCMKAGIRSIMTSYSAHPAERWSRIEHHNCN
jgi:hypothetical protein